MKRVAIACMLVVVGVLSCGQDCPARDAADLVRINRMLSGQSPPDLSQADIDGDGEVTEADLALMLREVHGLPAPVRLDREDIGPAGGDVGTPECLLDIPAGAFAETETLIVDRLHEEDAPRPDIEHGALYQVSGIPTETAQSLDLHMAVPAGLEANGLLIEMGEPTFNTNGEEWNYRCVGSVVTNGTLRWSMPPLAGKGGGARSVPEPAPTALTFSPSNYVFRFRVVRYSRLTGERFDLFFAARHSFNRTPLHRVLAALEDAYTTLNNPGGYGFSYGARTTWPLEVYIMDLGGKDGNHVSSLRGVNYDWLELDQKLLPKPTHARVTAGHEFFHLVQNMYASKPRNLWLDEMASTWFEREMSGQGTNYVPSTFAGAPRDALRGMHKEPSLEWVKKLGVIPAQQWNTGEAQSRGYGLSAFLEHLSQQPGWTSFATKEIYLGISAGQHPVEALAAAAGSAANLSNFWADFCNLFFENKVYPLKKDWVGALTLDTVTAEGNSRGPYGGLVKPIVTSLGDIARNHSYNRDVQQLGARTIRYSIVPSSDLPDPMTLTSEAQALTLGDMRDLRLLAKLYHNKDPAGWVLGAATAATTNLDTHMTLRMDVSFPRPSDRSFLLFALVNASANAPYTDRIPVTWSTFLTAYPFEPFSVAAKTMENGAAPVAVCGVSAATLKGDLGDVSVSDNPMGYVMDGAKRVDIKLPHDRGGELRLFINASLTPPTAREIPGIGGKWLVTVTEDKGWQVWTTTGGGEPVKGPFITPATANTVGLALP